MSKKKFIQSLFKFCLHHLDEKDLLLNQENKRLQESLSDEVKSSVGDKHETSRAMSHLEQEKIAQQAQNLIQQKKILTRLKDEWENEKTPSSILFETEVGFFFLCISIGKVNIEDNVVYIISKESPIAKTLLQNANNSFIFNGKEERILQVY